MRIAESILSVIIAFAVVYVVYQSDKQSPVKLTSASNNYSVEVMTVPTALEDTLLIIPVTITGEKSERIKYVFRYAKPNLRNLEQLHRYGTTPLTAVDSAAGLYKANIRTGTKGTLSHYFFEVRDPVGRYLAGIKLSGEKPLTTLAIGRVDQWINWGYYITMFIAILSISLGALSSLRLVTGKDAQEPVNWPFLIAIVFTIVSAYLLGTLFGIQITGAAWQGAPFGTDLGDNLKQILLVFLVFVLLATKQIKSKSGAIRRVFPKPLIGYLGIASFFMMILAYLLPLVAKSDYPHVSVIFYGFFTLLVIVYLLIFRSIKNA